MITSTAVELRAGRTRPAVGRDVPGRAGDKVGLVGRNGAGKTTLTRVLAGEGLPAAGTVDRSRRARLPAAGPAHRRPRAARQGPDPVRPRARRGRRVGMREPRLAMASRRPGRRDRAMRRYANLQERLAALGGYAAEAEAAHRRQPRPARPRARSAAADALGRSAPPGRAGPHPVLGRADAAARRADQPPRRRLDRVAARVPAHAQGRPGRDQPRRRAARARRSTGSSTSTPTGPSSTSTTSAGRRT